MKLPKQPPQPLVRDVRTAWLATTTALQRVGVAAELAKEAAVFRLSDEQLEDIRKTLKDIEKIDWFFTVEVKDESGAVIAEVQKQLHIRRTVATTTW